MDYINLIFCEFVLAPFNGNPKRRTARRMNQRELPAAAALRSKEAAKLRLSPAPSSDIVRERSCPADSCRFQNAKKAAIPEMYNMDQYESATKQNY